MNDLAKFLTESRICAVILFVNDSNAVDLADKLRDQGLQVTAQRIAVMEACGWQPARHR